MLNASLIGNLGSDPELKYTAGGDGRLTFNVASNGRRRGPTGDYVDETTWVRVTVFGKRAESLANYLKRGMRVYVDGRLEARPWKDRTDSPQAGLELMASNVEFMSPRNGHGDDDDLE